MAEDERPRQVRNLGIAAVGLGLVIVVFWMAREPTTPDASVLRVELAEGEVEISPAAGTGDEFRLGALARLKRGDLCFGSGGSRLCLDDGAVVESISGGVLLDRGRLAARASGRELVVQTSGGKVTASDATFGVQVHTSSSSDRSSSGRSVVVSVLSGRVRVRPPGAPTATLSAGERRVLGLGAVRRLTTEEADALEKVFPPAG